VDGLINQPKSMLIHVHVVARLGQGGDLARGGSFSFKPWTLAGSVKE